MLSLDCWYNVCHTANKTRFFFLIIIRLPFLVLLKLLRTLISWSLSSLINLLKDLVLNWVILYFILSYTWLIFCKLIAVGKIKPSAIGLSLIKGFDIAEGGGIELISHLITKHLNVSCSCQLYQSLLANELSFIDFNLTKTRFHVPSWWAPI